MKRILLALFLAVPFAAGATGNGGDSPAPGPAPSSDATATAAAGAEAAATAGAESKATADSKQTVTVSHEAGPAALGQGAVILNGCGFGANAGGSDSGGAGFLGVTFVTPGCWDAMNIANEAAFGNVRTACEMNRLTPAGKRNAERLREAGITPEPCRDPPPAPEATPPAAASTDPRDQTVTRGEMLETVNRAFETAVSKRTK